MVRAATKSQYRWFSLTVQLSNTVFSPAYFNDIIDFAKGQVELGTNLHYQIVLHTTKKITVPGLAKFIYGHLEGARNVEALKDYVHKDDDTTIGDKFTYGQAPINRNSATDWSVVRKAAQSQSWHLVPDDIMVRYSGNLLRLLTMLPEAPPFRPDIRVFYYWGDSGAGKSHAAFNESKYEEDSSATYVKANTTKWWDGYQGQRQVIIDDFEGDISLAHLKLWFDKYPCAVEVKGGRVPLMVNTFWVTSNYSPDDLCLKWNCNEQSKVAFKRRLTVKHFSRLM